MSPVRRAAIRLLAVAAIFSAPAVADRLAAGASQPPALTAQLVPPVQGGTIPPQNAPTCRFQRIRYCTIGVDCPSPLVAACIAPSRPVTRNGIVYCERLICN